MPPGTSEVIANESCYRDGGARYFRGGSYRGTYIHIPQGFPLKSWTAAAAGVALACACHTSSSRTGQQPGDAGGQQPGATPDAGQPTSVGPIDTEFPQPPTGPRVPLLPKLRNVIAVTDGDRVSVTFEPVDGAADYRIYPLPDAANVSVDDAGLVTIANQTYRCGGDREAPSAPLDTADHPGSWVATRVAFQVEGFARTVADATLGHVFVEPGTGRVPVYAAGADAPSADNECSNAHGNWGATRVKTYTTSKAAYDQLVAQGYRDDGIVFYAPASGTVPVMTSKAGTSTLYYSSPAEIAARVADNPAAAFSVLAAPADGTVPLKRVFYQGFCDDSHDELAAGESRFSRAASQGDQPVFETQWSGLTGKTILVVEALATGCPFQGHLVPHHKDAAGNAQVFLTLDEIRKASPSGEVFVNGQHDVQRLPQAIARSFVEVSPAPRPAADFSATFDGTPETFTLDSAGSGCGGIAASLSSPSFDARFYCTEGSPDPAQVAMYSLGQMMGEFWVSFADAGSLTNGKFRLTARQKATFSASAYLHATMMVDFVSTGRRYPQMLVSDVPLPVQENLTSGTTLILQSFDGWPSRLEVQVCDHKTWDVNDQCPRYDLERTPGARKWLGHQPLAERTGVGRLNRVDLWASASNAFVFLDGQPYGCADLTAAPAAGPVSVTFGDVIYHSGIDESVTSDGSKAGTEMSFHFRHQQTETHRQFDNLEFSSNQGAPRWDFARFPCATTPSLDLAQ
jgi:hypothetical protein